MNHTYNNYNDNNAIIFIEDSVCLLALQILLLQPLPYFQVSVLSSSLQEVKNEKDYFSAESENLQAQRDDLMRELGETQENKAIVSLLNIAFLGSY